MSESSSSELGATSPGAEARRPPSTRRPRITASAFRVTALFLGFLLALALAATYYVPWLRDLADVDAIREHASHWLLGVLGAEMARVSWVRAKPHLITFGWFLRGRVGAFVAWSQKPRPTEGAVPAQRQAGEDIKREIAEPEESVI